MAGNGNNVVTAIGFRADSSDFRTAEKDIRRVTQAQKDVEKQSQRTADSFGQLGRALRGLAAAYIVRETLELVDAYKNLNAQISLVTDSELERTRALESLTALANENGQSIASLANTYARLERSAEKLGLSQTEVLNTTEALSNAIISSGATAQEASAGLVQLSQGLASGALRGDELRSVLEQLPRVGTALSAGLNVSLGELRKLGEEGAITTQAVVEALRSQFDALKEEAEQIPDTFARSMERLRTSLVVAFGESDAANAFSDQVIGGINAISSAIPGAVNAFDALRESVEVDFGEVGRELFDLGLIIAGVGAAFGPVPALIIGAGVALAKFSDEIAQALTGTDDFVLALRTLGSVAVNLGSDLINLGRSIFEAFNIKGVFDSVVAASNDVSEDISRNIFGPVLYTALQAFGESMKAVLADSASSAGSAIADNISSAIDRAQQEARGRATALQIVDISAEIENVGELGKAIAELSGAFDGVEFSAEVKAAIAEAQAAIASSQDVTLGGDGATLKDNLKEAKALADDLKSTFDVLGVSIGESFAELDRPERVKALEQLRAALEATDSEEVREVFRGYIKQIEAIEDAAERGGKALSELARKPGESFSAFAARLKAAAGATKEASEEAVNAFKDAFGKIESQIADLELAAKAASEGGALALEDAQREAKIRTDAAELYKKALAAGAAITKETSEELIRQRETLAALADFETNFGSVTLGNELRDIAEQLAAIEEGGRKELERVQERQALEKEILALRLKAKQAGLSESDEIVAELELELREKKRKELDDAIDDLPDAGKDFVAIIDQGMNRAIGDFVSALLDGGADFGDLIGSILKDITRSVLAGPNGILTGLTNPDAETINLEEFFGSKTVDGKLEKRFTEIFEGFGDVLSDVSDDLGKAFKDIADDLGEAASGAAAGFAGFKLGSGAADFITGDEGETGGKVGGGVGGGIGFALGGPAGAFIGSAVGGFFGDLLGALFGKPSNKFARASFDPNTGAITGNRQKDNSEEANENAAAVRDFLENLRDGLAEIAEITGAEFGKALSIEINSRDGIVVGFGGFGPKGGPANSQTFTDIDEAMAFVVQQIVGSLTGAENQFTRLAKALAGANVPAQELASTLSTVSQIAKIGEDAPSQFRQALDDLEEAFNDAASATGNFETAIKQLAASQSEAVESLADAFDEDVGDRLRRITDPVAADVLELLKLQQQRIDDAQAINDALAEAAANAAAIPAAIQPPASGFGIGGQFPDFIGAFRQNQNAQQPVAANQNVANAAQLAADAQERLSQVLALNTAEFIQLIEGIADSPEAFASAQSAFEEFAQQIISQTDDIDAINAALAAASAGFRNAFDASVQDDIDELTNPVLYAFNQLIEKQAELEDFARTVGGDLFAVQRRNALERREFFKRLSEDERRQLVGLGDEIEDVFGRIGIVLQETFDGLDAQIDNGEELADTARSLGEAFKDAADELSDVRQSLLDEFFPGSPDAHLRDLLTRFEDARQRALGGDTDAASELGGIAEEIIALSRDINASSPAFFATLKSITDQILGVETILAGRADEQFDLADAIENDTDLLKQVRDLLAEDDPSIPVLEQIRDGLSVGNVGIRDLVTELISLVTLQGEQQSYADRLFEEMAAQAVQNSTASNVVPFQPQIIQTPAPAVTVNTPTAPLQQAIGYQTTAIVAAIEAQASKLDSLESDMSTLKTDMSKLVRFITTNTVRFGTA